MSKIDEARGQMGSRPERRLDKMYISKLKRLAGAAGGGLKELRLRGREAGRRSDVSIHLHVATVAAVPGGRERVEPLIFANRRGRR